MLIREVWNIPHQEVIKISGFNFISKQWINGRVGGAGFTYVNQKLIQNYTFTFAFSKKTFESITIEANVAKY
jgi:hypothetical protein